MTFHIWGQKDFDWKGLDGAVNYVESYSRRWGRIGGSAKEKFGCLRFYAVFGGLSLHTLFYPEYYYSKFPKWLWNLDVLYVGPFLDKLLGKPFVLWQKFIYNRAYQGALKRWPHIRPEILNDADYLEWIVGASKVVETETEVQTHVLGWNGETIGQWVRSKQ